MSLDRATGACVRILSLRLLLPILLFACLAMMLMPAANAVRQFPAHAQRGEINAHQYPYYTIGKTTYRMGAAGKIFNEQNMIVMPASVQKKTAHVMYTVDLGGNLHRVWLLTPAEAKFYQMPKKSAKSDKEKQNEGTGFSRN